jgi:DNA repair protein RadC
MGLHTPFASNATHAYPAARGLETMPAALADPLFLAYLHSRFAGANEERLHVVYCDDKDRYLHDETLIIGDDNFLVLRARPLIHHALAIGAGSIVLAHNHLSGQCRPSTQDIVATHRLQDLGAAVELTLLDHLIFTRERFFSMAAGGMLHR